MDYEQWKPLGRGDPLKNDPTYDYVPPVLDRVHYWIDPASRKPDPPNSTEMKKTEILVLGVSSKKPSTGFSTSADNRKDVFDSFLKFVESPNFNFQRGQRPFSASQNYYTSGYYKQSKLPEQQKEPYTMLVPPPIPSHLTENNYQPQISSTSTTTPVPFTKTPSDSSPIIEEANLIYHSSSSSSSGNWKGSNTYATIAETSNQVTWRTPTSDNVVLNNTQKTVQQLPTREASSFSIVPSMNIVMKPVNKLQNTTNMETDIVVSPSEITMHKGQVTDDMLDISSTYVSIGKPDAQMQTATAMGMDLISSHPNNKKPQSAMIVNSPLLSSVINPMIHQVYRKPHHAPKKQEMAMTLQSMQTLQTMLPPPSTQYNMIHSKKPFLHSLLKKESTTISTSTSTTTFSPPTTTSVASLTTDPLFKHYKQPVEPLRGPLYLIIQGHSKVKTYGPSKQINGISVQETNEIPTSEDRQTEYPVKHLHELMKENRQEWDREKRDSRTGRLQTLNHVIVTGLGALDFANLELAAKRRNDDVKETEFVLKYDVSSGEDVTSEVYHKGIVESEIPPNRKNSSKPLSVKFDS